MVGALLLAGAWSLLSGWAVCPFATLTGQPCPGCGMTRAALALLNLDLGRAIRWHPLSPVCVPLVSLLACSGVLSYVRQRNVSWLMPLSTGRAAGWLWGTLAAALLVVWIVRFYGLLGGPVSI